MLTHLQNYKSPPEPRVLGMCGEAGEIGLWLEPGGLLRRGLVSLDFPSWGALKELKSKNGWHVKKKVEEREEEMISFLTTTCQTVSTPFMCINSLV